MISRNIPETQSESISVNSNSTVSLSINTHEALERLRANRRHPIRQFSDHKSRLLPGTESRFDRLNPCGAQVWAVLKVLQLAWDCARDCNYSAWDLAVEISEFTSSNISRQTLRQLACIGWIANRREVTVDGQLKREFEREPYIAFSDRSCFILTPLGLSQFRNQNQKTIMQAFKDDSEESRPAQQHVRIDGVACSPVWDAIRRELRLGEIVVKRFKWPAENQTSILDTFEDLGWPKKISDPLPQNSKICPKRRLHDTIKCLNRKREHDLIRFRGDGTGQGVVIEFNVDR